MRLHTRIAATTLVLTSAAALSTQLALGKKKDAKPTSQMEEHKRAQHALSRLTFGARPGDIDRVMAMGVNQWIEQQLHPPQRTFSGRLVKHRPAVGRAQLSQFGMLLEYRHDCVFAAGLERQPAFHDGFCGTVRGAGAALLTSSAK